MSIGTVSLQNKRLVMRRTHLEQALVVSDGEGQLSLQLHETA